MKLYLVSTDAVLQKRLAKIFAGYVMEQCSSFPLSAHEKDIALVEDTVLNGMSDAELEMIFSLHVMILSRHPKFEQARFFLAKGAMGYGNAMMHKAHLYSVYQTIMEGNIWLIPEYIRSLILKLPQAYLTEGDPLEVLSPREKEVALLLAEGDSHKEIADKLDITVRTIKAHATAIYHKLGIKDRLCLALLLRK